MSRRTVWLWTAAAIVIGVVHASLQAWVCDDAFISYRYAMHLVKGHGLVFNLDPAEAPVEGYSNFLWTVLLAAGMWGGAEPILLSQVLGIVCFGGTIFLLARFAKGQPAGGAALLPIAALGFASLHHAAIFATGGLETMLFTFLGTAGVLQLIHAERATQFGLAGLWFIVAAMTRPDGALCYAMGGGLVLWLAVRQGRWSALVAYAIPALIIFVPFFALKYAYYGYPFPNTAYAKSASKPYFTQGVFYVYIFFRHYLILAPLLLLPLLLLARRRSSGLGAGTATMRAPLLIAVWLFGDAAYVAWVGGDFMFGRFCIPFVPALFLGLQLFLANVPGRMRTVLAAVVLLGVVAANLLIHTGALQKAGYRQSHHIGDSPRLYAPWVIDGSRQMGEQLEQHLRGTGAAVTIEGGEAMLAYYGEFPVVVERYGLTDAHIAHREIASRGLIGHEKGIAITDPYLRRRRVSLVFGTLFQAYHPHLQDRIAELRRIEFRVRDVATQAGPMSGWAKVTLLTYQKSVMDVLRGRDGVRFQPFEEHLDRYIADLPNKKRSDVEADYEAFRAFYFEHNADPDRKKAFEDYLK